MHSVISAAVSLLCLFLGNADAAFDENDDFQLNHLASVINGLDALHKYVDIKVFKPDLSNGEYNVQRFPYVNDDEVGFVESHMLNPLTKYQYYIIHGWAGNKDEAWISDMAKAISKSNKNAAILFEWKTVAVLDYVQAVYATKVIGGKLADLIIDDYRKGEVDLNRVTLIGHGLGAHVAGVAGKKIRKVLGKKVGKIIGVSPAGPLYNEEHEDRVLRKSDAKCVAAVHSDTVLYGFKEPIGGLDFYPNGGNRQPGCSNVLDECSYFRAASYLTEAFELVGASGRYSDGKKHFIEMARGNCGIGWGNYFFVTRNEPPYL